MANSLGLNANEVAGLGTFSYTVPVGGAGLYTLSCQSTLPFEQGTFNNSSVTPSVASALQIVLSQTGSASVSITIGGSATNPTPTQPAMGTSGRFQCAAGDVLSVALTSANAIDAAPNNVKSIVNLYQGY
jgi:hypothetical protein